MSSREARISLPSDVHDALRQTAEQTGVPPDTLLERAVREYLGKTNQEELAREARRQSVRASEHDADDDAWKANIDTTGWHA